MKNRPKYTQVPVGNITQVEVIRTPQLPEIDRDRQELVPLSDKSPGDMLLEAYQLTHRLMNDRYDAEDFDRFMDCVRILAGTHREIRESLLNIAADPDRKVYESTLTERIANLTAKRLADLGENNDG